MKLTSKSILSATSLLVGGFIGASALVALAGTSTWSGPHQTPSNCDPNLDSGCYAPLNIGSNTQTKLGSLILNAATPIQNAIGLTVFGTSTFNGPIQIADGTQGAGKVLTSDLNGNASWQTGSGGGGTSGIVFITPVVLAGPSISTSWKTVDLTKYGVPANASAAILSTDIITYNANGDPLAHIYMRPNSSGQTYVLAGTRTAGGGAPVLGSSNQGIYPISSASSFDYKADSTVSTDSSINLVGYVTGDISAVNVAPSVTTTVATTSAGSVGGGCYASNGGLNHGGGFGGFKFASWGNATLNPVKQGIYYGTSLDTGCVCPSDYSLAITGSQWVTDAVGNSSLSGYVETGAICIKK